MWQQSGGPLSSLTSRGELHVTLTFVLPEDAASQDEETGQGQGELRVRIHQAKELLSLRATGTTDAFCTGFVLLAQHIHGFTISNNARLRLCVTHDNNTVVTQSKTYRLLN